MVESVEVLDTEFCLAVTEFRFWIMNGRSWIRLRIWDYLGQNL